MSLLVESLVAGGVALELVGAGVLAHGHNAESIVELRDQIAEEGTALGEPDALATHARLLAQKRVGFLFLTLGLVVQMIGLIGDSTESTVAIGAVAVGAIVLGLVVSVFATRYFGARYLDQAREAQQDGDPDVLPEQ